MISPSPTGESIVSMSQAFRSTRVLTSQGLAAAALIVEGGRIAAICDWGDVPASAEMRDFGNLIVLPGLVDTHVHINDPGRDWEGFATATRAAAAGGVTTLVDMPLNCVPETIDVVAFDAKREAARGQVWVDWAAWGGMVRRNHGSLESLARAGVRGFKCFLIDSGIEGFAWVNEAALRLGLERLRETGLPLLVHAEVAGPVNAATESMNRAGADWSKYSTYLASRPDEAETEAIALLIQLAGEFQHPIHIVHLSSVKALPMLRDARERGLPITVETCAHYLWFDGAEIADGSTEYKCAPPIRGSANCEVLWKALEDGIIDMVTTDHSPCPAAMKHSEEDRWDRAWGGIASLGLALPVMWTAMSRRGIAMEKIGVWMCAAPARLAGLSGRKGTFAVGADADFSVFDPDAKWTVTVDDLHFRHKLSPYLGAELRGRVMEAWLRGERVYGDGQFNGPPSGRELVNA